MKSFWDSLKMLLWMTVLTGLIYPLGILLIVQLSMPKRSNGSLIKLNDQIIGSKLIGQKFESDRYFWPRPSASDYSAYPAKASHLGPTSAKLMKLIQERRFKLAKSHETKDLSTIPIELLCASASGIDPHISKRAAYFQIARVINARGMSDSMKLEIEELISKNLDKPIGRFFGEPCVNVFMLNLALDAFEKQKDSNGYR